MIIAVDFDGTLCDDSKFPLIGKERLEVINWVKNQKQLGNQIILWTCREGQYLIDAIEWCKKRGLYFDSINENIPFLKYNLFGQHKILADIYLDDKARSINEIIKLQKIEDFVRS